MKIQLLAPDGTTLSLSQEQFREAVVRMFEQDTGKRRPEKQERVETIKVPLAFIDRITEMLIQDASEEG